MCRAMHAVTKCLGLHALCSGPAASYHVVCHDFYTCGAPLGLVVSAGDGAVSAGKSHKGMGSDH